MSFWDGKCIELPGRMMDENSEKMIAEIERKLYYYCSKFVVIETFKSSHRQINVNLANTFI